MQFCKYDRNIYSTAHNCNILPSGFRSPAIIDVWSLLNCEVWRLLFTADVGWLTGRRATLQISAAGSQRPQLAHQLVCQLSSSQRESTGKLSGSRPQVLQTSNALHVQAF